MKENLILTALIQKITYWLLTITLMTKFSNLMNKLFIINQNQNKPMSDAYDRLMKAREKKKEPHRVGKASRKLISIEDSFDQENDDQNDVFKNEDQINSISFNPAQIPKGIQNREESRRREEQRSVNQRQTNTSRMQSESSQFSPKKSPSKQKKREAILELVDDEDLDHGTEEEQKQKSASRNLTIVESFNLLMGHFMSPYVFPLKREIPIIANVEDLEREKYENGTYVSEAFDNDISVSFIPFLLRAVIFQIVLKPTTLLWLIAVLFSWLIDSNEQYRVSRPIVLILFILYLGFGIVLQYQSVKGRRNWRKTSSENTKFKVYHYDSEHNTAEWILTSVIDLRPGNIYKVPAGCRNVPADSVLLHGSRRIVQVDESEVIEYLSPLESQEKVSLKETVIEKEGIVLPLTGVIHYELQAPDIRAENITGRLMLQEPTRVNYNILYQNILLRGTKIAINPFQEQREGNKERIKDKRGDLLAIVLETGIDSLSLKSSQYPYQYRTPTTTSKVLDSLILVCSLSYMILICLGILIGYISLHSPIFARGYYIDNYIQEFKTSSKLEPVTIKQIVFHHLANLIVVVPILLKVCYLLYLNVMGRVIGAKVGVEFKDMQMVSECGDMDVLITTLGGDLVRSNHGKTNIMEQSDRRQQMNNRLLQSIKVKQIHHNFQRTAIDSEIYSTEDVDLLLYFMSIALLTTTSAFTSSTSSPSPLEEAIISCCSSQLQLKLESHRSKGKNQQELIQIGQLKVHHLMTIPPSNEFPFKMLFFKHSKQNIVEDYLDDDEERGSNSSLGNEKILCLVRGDPQIISKKIGEKKKNSLGEYSSHLHQQKGFHIEMLGKFVLTYTEFLHIRKAYLAGSDPNQLEGARAGSLLGIDSFYSNLDRFMMKVESMGLLIWDNPYNIASPKWAPISSVPYPQYKIIIAPPSKSLFNPEFDSIHSITNYLLNTFKLPLQKISNKIIHGYPGKQTFWNLLKEEQILVLNGWENVTIRKMLQDLTDIDKINALGSELPKKQNKKTEVQISANNQKIKILGYIEHDEYAWILKETHLSLVSKGDGFDLQKYSDINLKRSSLTTPQKLTSMCEYSLKITSNLSCLLMSNISKCFMLAAIELIHFFYTWGTGLVFIDSGLFMILEIGLFMDIFYYFVVNLSHNEKTDAIMSINKGESEQRYVLTLRNILVEIFMNLVLAAGMCLLSVYSMSEPPTSSGTFAPKQFTNILILFILYHSLIFRKIFYPPFTISLYKALILALQVLTFYIGLIILSEVDQFRYRGAVWYALSGRTVLVGIFTVWMVVGIYWLRFMVGQLLKNSKGKAHVYEKIERKQKDWADGKSEKSSQMGSEKIEPASENRRSMIEVIDMD